MDHPSRDARVFPTRSRGRITRGAGERNDPQEFAYVRSGRFPDLRELSNRSAGATIYDVGYTIVEFVESRWGHDATLRLIESYGDTKEALGVDATEFVRLWQEFVEAKVPAWP